MKRFIGARALTTLVLYSHHSHLLSSTTHYIIWLPICLHHPHHHHHHHLLIVSLLIECSMVVLLSAQYCTKLHEEICIIDNQWIIVIFALLSAMSYYIKCYWIFICLVLSWNIQFITTVMWYWFLHSIVYNSPSTKITHMIISSLAVGLAW